MIAKKLSRQPRKLAPISAHVIRLQSRLVLCPDGPAVRVRGTARSQKIHLQQSDLDGACGPHALLTALLLLGVMKRREITQIIAGKVRGARRRFWQLAREYFFAGTTVAELLMVLKPLAATLTISVSEDCGAALIDFVLAHLALDRLVVLGIAYRRRSLDHWVLAVGVAGRARGDAFITEHILLLDPSDAAIPLSGWNSMVAINRTLGTRRYRQLGAYGKPCDVGFDSALAIGLAGKRIKRRSA
jgi:hypothetical protein